MASSNIQEPQNVLDFDVHRTVRLDKGHGLQYANTGNYDAIKHTLGIIRAVTEETPLKSVTADVHFKEEKSNKIVVAKGSRDEGVYGGFSCYMSHTNLLLQYDKSAFDLKSDTSCNADVSNCIKMLIDNENFDATGSNSFWFHENDTNYNAFMCFKLTVCKNTFDKAYKIVKDDIEGGHCTIFYEDEDLLLQEITNKSDDKKTTSNKSNDKKEISNKSDVKKEISNKSDNKKKKPIIIKAFMDPVKSKNKVESWITGSQTYTWAPCHIFLKAGADHFWFKYRHYEENFDVYIKEVITALMYVYGTMASLEELGEIESLIQNIVRTCTNIVDIHCPSKSDITSLQYMMEACLNRKKTDGRDH